MEERITRGDILLLTKLQTRPMKQIPQVMDFHEIIHHPKKLEEITVEQNILLVTWQADALNKAFLSVRFVKQNYCLRTEHCSCIFK